MVCQFFFFQAEDGIRDLYVTGVQTCALPILGFVFGSERFGLRNEDVYRCHACVSIPTHPDYGSLNLAQAVQLVAYDWRQALGGFAVEPRTPVADLADAPALEGLVAHWEQALVHLGYLDPQIPRKLKFRLQQLANRLELTRDELQILRGVARAIEALPAPVSKADAPVSPRRSRVRP